MNAAKQLYNVPGEKECQLWREHRLTINNQLSKLDETIQDAGLCTGQVCVRVDASMLAYMCMHMYVTVYLSMCVYVCVYVHVWVCVCAYMCPYMCVFIFLCHLFVLVYMDMYVYAYIRTCMPVHLFGG